ncbi:MAG: RluA family pseudouridine synthase, partial [Treponema sp.]|nr:RluA family pseudouridine synthase [Treponema sp.]
SQAASHGHPLAGDKKYGGAPFPGGFFLHAAELELPPETPDSPRIIRAELPEAFAGAVREIFDKQE